MFLNSLLILVLLMVLFLVDKMIIVFLLGMMLLKGSTHPSCQRRPWRKGFLGRQHLVSFLHSRVFMHLLLVVGEFLKQLSVDYLLALPLRSSHSRMHLLTMVHSSCRFNLQHIMVIFLQVLLRDAAPWRWLHRLPRWCCLHFACDVAGV